jgi:hypothetical protein
MIAMPWSAEMKILFITDVVADALQADQRMEPDAFLSTV